MLVRYASKPAGSSVGVADTYRDRAERFRQDGNRAKRHLSMLMHGRLATFLSSALFVAFGAAREEPQWLPVAIGGVLGAGYAVLVVAHRRAKTQVAYINERVRLNEEALHRLARNWQGVPASAAEPPGSEHPNAADLDLFGKASLFRLICTAATPLGRGYLRDWLVDPAEPDVVAGRQEAVAELASRLDLREELIARGRLIGDIKRSVFERFVLWTDRGRWILDRPWLIGIAWLLPLVTVALVILRVTGIVPYHLWVFTVIGCVTLRRRFRRDIDDVVESASSGETALRRFPSLFQTVSELSFSAPLLQTIAGSFVRDGRLAHHQMRRLDRILTCADVRFSDLLHGLLQAFTLWDLHVVVALERWRETNRSCVEPWFSAYGSLEALTALAGLAHGHPDWTFPRLASGSDRRLVAKDLGHPLLAPDECVVNDVELGPPGKFMLLTGSNMSGKSTLLRAIGVNVVLAQAGAPVCATEMALPPARLFTAMHVHDSLADGVSQFMAALKRLQLVVESAHRAESDGEAFIFLLDEILQGTNAAERQTAVRRIMRHMLDKGAIGATSTHDLTLADTADLKQAAIPVHFEETIERTEIGPIVSFDYKLKPGLATSTNALKLMDIVGL